MKVLVAYFSATGNTARMAEVIQRELAGLGAEAELLDITSYADRQKPLDLKPYRAAVFGFPVHANRAPRITRDWLDNLDGNGMPCATYYTYGGFRIHPSHHWGKLILGRRNFDLVASAEFLGAHTYNHSGWRAMEGRPDESDFEVAREFAGKIYARFAGSDPGRVGDFETTDFSEEQLDQFEHHRYRMILQLPTRGGAECGLCLDCEELCPTGAMDAESGETDRDRCILCLRCLADCPEEALSITDLSQAWQMKLERENETAESMGLKKSRIYL